MKIKLFNMFCLLAITRATAFATSYVFTITPAIDAPLASEVFDYTVEFLEKMAVGDELLALSGEKNPQTIFAFKKGAYANRQVRDRSMNPPQQNLESFLRSRVAQPNNGAIPGEIAIPEVVEFVGRLSKRPDRLVLIGNYAVNSRGSEFVTKIGSLDLGSLRRPSYSYFDVEPLLSPFSTKSRGERLKGVSVFWWCPKRLVDPWPIEFTTEIENFYGAWFARQGATMSPFKVDRTASLSDVFGKGQQRFTWPGSRREESERPIMLTIAEIMGREFEWAMNPIANIFVVDVTGSMKPYHDSIARKIAGFPETPGKKSVVVVFCDYNSPNNRPAYRLFESDAPSKIAAALQEVPLEDSRDEPEAMGEGLRVALELLEERKSAPVLITIITDAPPKPADYKLHESEKAPPGGIADYKLLLDKLLQRGDRIEVVACNPKPEASEWVPPSIKKLSLAEWKFQSGRP